MLIGIYAIHQVIPAALGLVAELRLPGEKAFPQREGESLGAKVPNREQPHGWTATRNRRTRPGRTRALCSHPLWPSLGQVLLP